MQASKTLRALGVTAAMLLASVSAQALTVAATTPIPAANGSQDLPGTVSLSGDAFLNATGSVANEKRSPWDTTTTNSDTRKYHYVKDNGSITLTLAQAATALEFVWGSPDNYNTLELYRNSESTPFATIIPNNSLVPIDSIASYLVTITAQNSSEFFNKIVFKSSIAAFEFANVKVTAVPIPAAAWLFISALGSLVLVGRRRRMHAAQA